MESYEVPLNGDALRLTVTVQGYERALADHESDLNWLHAEVRIVAGETSAGFPCAFTTGELEDLARDIDSLLSSRVQEVVWESEEMDLALTFQLQKSGGAKVKGTSKRQQGISTTLMFATEVNSSQLEEFRDGLLAALTRFPSRVPKDSLPL